MENTTCGNVVNRQVLDYNILRNDEMFFISFSLRRET